MIIIRSIRLVKAAGVVMLTNMSTILIHNLGYPRIGENRELKKATEAYWKGELSLEALEQTGANLRQVNWQKQRLAGLDFIPCGDFSFYDHVLDATCMVGNVPPRFQWTKEECDLEARFLIARGRREGACPAGDEEKDCPTARISTFASEMTKWFDTNYHYIVPEFSSQTRFRLASSQIVRHFNEARALGLPVRPVLLGPVTYLTLGKVHDRAYPDFNRFNLLDQLVPVYEDVLRRLRQWGAEWVQIDEPVLALDLSEEQRRLLAYSWERLKNAAPGLRLLLASYFGPLRSNLDLAVCLPCHALHVDAVRGADEVETIARRLPTERILSLGIVDGRNIWKTDLAAALQRIENVLTLRPQTELWLAPSCSLLHCPITLRNEPHLDAEFKNWLAFADEKLGELALLRDLALGRGDRAAFERHQAGVVSRRTSPRIHHPAVQARLSAVRPVDYQRRSPFPARQRAQHEKLRLPLFPTTTIGSFPQTPEVRAARAKWKKGS